jgi:regulatory protein
VNGPGSKDESGARIPGTHGERDPRHGAKEGRPGRERPQQTPVQRALGLLARREHSRKELTRKLTTRGVEAADAQHAVERLVQAGWQDDARFAESLVRSRAASGYGPLYIRAELGMHGLVPEAVAAALEGYDGQWLDNACDLVRRRYPAAQDDRATRLRAAAMLGRRGFAAEHIRAATRLDPDEQE